MYCERQAVCCRAVTGGEGARQLGLFALGGNGGNYPLGDTTRPLHFETRMAASYRGRRLLSAAR